MLTNRRIQPFHFQKLPAELRNKIYRYVFDEEGIQVYPTSIQRTDSLEYRRGTKSRSNLLCVCSQLYHESLPYRYRDTPFYLNTVSDLLTFLKRIGPVARANITTIHLNWFHGPLETAAEAFKLLASCTSLVELWLGICERRLVRDFKCSCDGHLEADGQQATSLRCIKGMSELRQIRGLNQVTIFPLDTLRLPKMFKDIGFTRWMKEGMMAPREATSHATSVGDTSNTLAAGGTAKAGLKRCFQCRSRLADRCLCSRFPFESSLVSCVSRSTFTPSTSRCRSNLIIQGLPEDITNCSASLAKSTMRLAHFAIVTPSSLLGVL